MKIHGKRVKLFKIHGKTCNVVKIHGKRVKFVVARLCNVFWTGKRSKLRVNFVIRFFNALWIRKASNSHVKQQPMQPIKANQG